MLKWLKENLGFSFGPLPDERRLAVDRKLQSIQLEMAEYKKQLATLRDDLERYQANESARTEEAIHARLERLLTDLAAPVAHLLTQAHLLEVQGQSVPARDVLIVAKSLIRKLADEGLTAEGHVGEWVSFDPNHHEPLDGATFAVGQPVVMRFVGLAYRGKLVRKAGVAQN